MSPSPNSVAARRGVEWSGVEWSGMEWSGVEWSWDSRPLMSNRIPTDRGGAPSPARLEEVGKTTCGLEAVAVMGAVMGAGVRGIPL